MRKYTIPYAVELALIRGELDGMQTVVQDLPARGMCPAWLLDRLTDVVERYHRLRGSMNQEV
jgi:hypothetical protein